MTPAASAALLALARKIDAAPLATLYRLTRNYTLPPSPRLLEITGGRDVSVTGDADPGLRIHPDGSMTVYAPFAWDGCSPRAAVRFMGRVVMTVGTPNGPRLPGGIRAATRGGMLHDRVCSLAEKIAGVLGIQPWRVYAAADLLMLDVVSEDWSPRAGRFYYWFVSRFGDAYRSFG
jgi:hypothetical protein